MSLSREEFTWQFEVSGRRDREIEREGLDARWVREVQIGSFRCRGDLVHYGFSL